MGGPHVAASLPKEQPCPSAGRLCQGPAAMHTEKGGSGDAGESLLGGEGGTSVSMSLPADISNTFTVTPVYRAQRGPQNVSQ